MMRELRLSQVKEKLKIDRDSSILDHKKGHPQASALFVIVSAFLERLDDIFDHFLRVREQHHRIVSEEKLILDPGIA